MKNVQTRVLAALLAVVIVLGMFPVISSAAYPQLDSSADYVLVNKATGKVLERTLDTSYIPSRNDVFRVVAGENKDTENQKWQLSIAGKGFRPLCAANRKIGLHKTAEAYTNILGANFVMAVETNAAPQQTWEIDDLGNGYVTIKNNLREAANSYDLPQYLAVTSDEFAEIPGSVVVAAVADGSSDNALWKLEKVPGTGTPPLEPLDPFEPVENAVNDVQSMLGQGSVKLSGMADTAAVHTQNEELKKLNWTRLVDPFRYKTDTYRDTWQNWRGEFWGKYMRGACFTYAYTQDEELYAIMEATVRDLLSAQELSGRISSNATDSELETRDMWNRKYVMIGLESFLDISGDEELNAQILEALCRHADQMLTFLGPEAEGKTPVVKTGDWNGLSSASILEPFVNLYRLTGYQRYLDLCTEIVDAGFTNVDVNIIDLAAKGEPIPSEYMRDQTKAYELTSCFEGLAEYYRITGVEKYRTACLNYYRLVSENELTVAGSGGGVGHNSDYTYPNPNGGEQWNHMKENQTDTTIREMQETCITVTWMKYCNQVLRLAGDSKIADDIEISAYNALIGALQAEGVETPDYPFLFDYFSLLNGTRKNAGGGAIFMSDGQPIGSCCSANGSSGTGLFPYVELMHSENGVVFNMYNPGSITAPAPSGQTVHYAVDTAYPKEGNIKITVNPEREETFSISLRIPQWSARTTLKINGEEQAVQAGRYAELSRTWKAGDTIELSLDMRTRIIKDAKGLGMVALQRGPITLARDVRFEENIDKPVSIATDADGFAVAVLCDTEVPCNIALQVQATDGTSFHVMDFASAGQTWNSESRYATWLTTAESLAPGLIDGAEYLLISKGSGIAMTANAGNDNVENGTKPAGDTAPDNQLWKFVPAGEFYKIVNLKDGKLLSITQSGSVGNGSNVLVQEDIGSDRQLWTVTKSGDGYVKIMAKLAKQLVSEAGGSTNIHLWEDVANPVQVWQLELYKMPVDITALEDAVTAAAYYEGKETDYTPASWKTFKNALDKAMKVKENPDADQSAVNAAADELNAAVAGLTKRADKKALDSAVTAAAAYEGKGAEYTADSWKAFEDALAEANKQKEDPDAEQNAVNAAAETLNAAITGLVKTEPPVSGEANKTILKAVYDYATKAKQGSEYAGVIGSVKASFDAAYAEAERIYRDEKATQEDVDGAWKELMKEIHKLGFQAGDKKQLELLLFESDKIDLSRYVEAGQKEYTEAAAKAEACYNDADALKEDVQEAVDKLLHAMMNLRLKADKRLLAAALAEAAQIDIAGYTKESVDVFQAAQSEAEETMKNEELSEKEQGQVTRAAENLHKAISGLEKKQAAEGDTQMTKGTNSAKTGENIPLAGALTVCALAGAVLLFKKRKEQ